MSKHRKTFVRVLVYEGTETWLKNIKDFNHVNGNYICPNGTITEYSLKEYLETVLPKEENKDD